ncbi:MAG TPA: hypothetical protein VFA56_12970 [Gaiellaceae bacterium]|nr:hypothetical protein [Gaiellaceae bacterium]
MTTIDRGFGLRQMLNKVPEVTLYFWVIKVLCTTVGETASDYLSENVGLGLTKTTFITAGLLIVTLVFQFRLLRYVAGVYWTGIVLISVVGTQITDNLHDNHGVALTVETSLFGGLLAIAFLAWWLSERTLSIHTIYTTRREAFYWLVVLFTFALGTAGGDLIAERYSLGYTWALLLFVGAIALVAALHYGLHMNAVWSFWLAYILTRPLGASTGDLLSAARKDGGLGLGTTVTSFAFLGAILAVVTFLTITKRDVTEIEAESRHAESHASVLLVAGWTAATPAMLDAVRDRIARGPATFHLLVPNPSDHAEITDGERRRHHEDGERVLALALPLLEEATGGPVDGSVSIRNDAMDAVEETLRDGEFHEIVVATMPKHVSHWLHVDLPRRLSRTGLPVTTVTAGERAVTIADDRVAVAAER